MTKFCNEWVKIVEFLTIAIFFGNIIREETNSVFPCFSPKKSVFSGHEWLQFECRAKRDILEAMNDRNTLTLQGEKQGKTEFVVSIII